MRLAFDYQAFCRQSTGGISRYFCRLAQELHAAGQAVGVFAPFYRNQYLARIREPIVHGKALQSYPPRTAEAAVAVNRWISRGQVRRWGPDVLHETYFSGVSVAPAGCPVVVTVFDMIPELEQGDNAGDLTALRSSAKYNAVQRADHVICISEQTRTDLIRLYRTPAEKVSVAYLGCDGFSPSASTDRPLAADMTERPFLLYVGLREGYKNFAGLLRGIASSPRLAAEFDLVAFGGGPFSVQERAEIARLGFRQNQVRQQPGEDRILASLYRAAVAFVYPSMYEGFGLPPLEAMRQDCPVICSDRSAIPEIVADAGAYFDPAQPESIAQAIEGVVYSAARRSALIGAGRARAARFTWALCAQSHLGVYRSLVSA